MSEMLISSQNKMMAQGYKISKRARTVRYYRSEQDPYTYTELWVFLIKDNASFKNFNRPKRKKNEQRNPFDYGYRGPR
jgi:hypothetical protein